MVELLGFEDERFKNEYRFRSDVSFKGFISYGKNTFQKSAGFPFYWRVSDDHQHRLMKNRIADPGLGKEIANVVYLSSCPYDLVFTYEDKSREFFYEKVLPIVECAVDDFIFGKNYLGHSPIPLGKERMRKMLNKKGLENLLLR